MNVIEKMDRFNFSSLRSEYNASSRSGFLEFFVISQTVIPALLYLPGTQAFRVPLRVTAFGISLAALYWWWQGQPKKQITNHPAKPWLILTLLCLVIMIFHPTTNTFGAGVAQTLLYLAVMAPVFWVPSMIRGPQHLMRLLAIFLICNGINSIVGILQVYNPDFWLPRDFSSIITSSKYGLSAVSYVGLSGQIIVRPPGLTDTPGAVCVPGMIAALLGLVFSLSSIKNWKRIGAFGLAVAGTGAVYLSQVRTSFLILCGMIVVYVGGLILQKRFIKASAFMAISILLVSMVLTYAIIFGGQSIQKRFETLVSDDPITVYYKTGRGGQFDYTFNTLLPQYPFGAGLARWGMMRYYFGDESNLDSPPIWSEFQIPSWGLDGGIPLVLLYCSALLSTMFYELRLSKNTRDPVLQIVAPIVAAVNIGTIAFIFGFTPFTTQIGLQYWFLAGALHGAARVTLFKNEPLRISKR